MKIGFDARMIDHPGIGRYISCLLSHLVKQASSDEIVLFGSPNKLRAFSGLDNVSIRSWAPPVYSFWEQLFSSHVSDKLDLYHVPHFNIPLSYSGKMVVTIHDLIYILLPEAQSSPMAKHFAHFMIGSAMKKADKVITVSKHTKQDLLKIYGDVFADKIEVIYEAPGKDFYKIKDKSKIADVRTRYRLSNNILLYVGSIKPHKNVVTLIKVFTLLKEWGIPHQLVICGRWDKKEDHLREKLDDKYIRYLGEIPTRDLVVLYNMADVLVHLSLYEGFGLTVIEAMKCGTPVVVSDTSSLPEVVGDAAFVVPPHDTEQIANTIYNIIVNKQLKEGMIETGSEHVRQFSWEQATRLTREVYQEALHGPGQ